MMILNSTEESADCLLVHFSCGNDQFANQRTLHELNFLFDTIFVLVHGGYIFQKHLKS